MADDLTIDASANTNVEDTGDATSVSVQGNVNDVEVGGSATIPRDSSGDNSRLDILESTVKVLSETVGDVVKALTEQSPDVQPQKLPWTAWGSKR